MPFYHVEEVLHHSEENTDRNIVFNMSLSIYLTKKKIDAKINYKQI